MIRTLSGFLLILMTAPLLMSQEDSAPRHEVLSTEMMSIEKSSQPAAADPTRVPMVLVERVLTIGRNITRITLFDNRVAVTTVRENGKQVFFRKWTFAETEYQIYLKALAGCVPKAGLTRHENVDSPNTIASVSMHLKGMAERSFTYSPFQVQDISSARLISVLDDIQERVRSMPPSAEELQFWQPKEGDRVELYNGSFARVDEVRETGVLVLQHEETSIIEVVPFEAWAKIIFRIVK